MMAELPTTFGVGPGVVILRWWSTRHRPERDKGHAPRYRRVPARRNYHLG